MSKRKIEIEAEFAPAEFFGRSDLRFNRLITDLHERGLIEDTTDAAFGHAIGRLGSTIGRWRAYKSFPNSVSLVLMARKFNVDINWIVGLRGNSISDAYMSEPMEIRKAA